MFIFFHLVQCLYFFYYLYANTSIKYRNIFMKTKHCRLSIYTMSIDSLAYIRIQWLSLAFFPLTSKFSQYFLVLITVSLCLMLHYLPTLLFYCYINYEATIWLIVHHFLQILSWVKLISIFTSLCCVTNHVNYQVSAFQYFGLMTISRCWKCLSRTFSL